MATLAESFLADLADLEDDDNPPEDEQEEQEDGEDDMEEDKVRSGRRACTAIQAATPAGRRGTHRRPAPPAVGRP